jgi:hypothetical protein
MYQRMEKLEAERVSMQHMNRTGSTDRRGSRHWQQVLAAAAAALQQPHGRGDLRCADVQYGMMRRWVLVVL